MREFPKNPNTRPPYSDIMGEVNWYIGGMIESWMYYRAQVPPYTDSDKMECDIQLQAISQVLLRLNAILFPDGMTEEDWQKAIAKDSYTVEKELWEQTKDKPAGRKP